MAEVGVRITDEETLDILKSRGATIDRELERVKFDESFLEKALHDAPSQFMLCSRDGRNDLKLGEGRVHFSSGGRVFRILDLTTGGYRSTLLRDVAATATLVDKLEFIDFYIIACQAHDLEAEKYHLNDFYHSLNHTTKHVMGGCDTLAGAQQVWDLAKTIAGSSEAFRERPFVSVITNPISPLTFESGMLKILRFCCEQGIPATCAPAAICGATAPATLAGTLVQSHAEALAGVAIAQSYAPGAKVLYGAVATSMDLRTMNFCMGSVEMAMMNGFAVDLAKYCKLPIYASAGITESKRPDIQAGVEKTFSNLATALTGGDVIHLAAGMLDSGNSISYEQYVIDNEIIGMVKRMVSGITITEDTLAVDVISKVGPGGNYVIEDHTLDHMCDEFFYPELAVRNLFDVWQADEAPSMLSRATDRVNAILAENEDGLLDRAVIKKIQEACPGLQSW